MCVAQTPADRCVFLHAERQRCPIVNRSERHAATSQGPVARIRNDTRRNIECCLAPLGHAQPAAALGVEDREASRAVGPGGPVGKLCVASLARVAESDASTTNALVIGSTSCRWPEARTTLPTSSTCTRTLPLSSGMPSMAGRKEKWSTAARSDRDRRGLPREYPRGVPFASTRLRANARALSAAVWPWRGVWASK